MSSRAMRLASVVTVVVLSGAPTMLSACAALCLPGFGPAAMDAAEQAVFGGDAADHFAPASHAHHGASESPAQDHATALHRVAGVATAADPSAVTGTDHSCCPDARALGLVSVAVASPRADSAAPLVFAVALVPLQNSRRPVPVAYIGDPIGARPSPTRTALVLRI
jgi:hypothetical protein